MLKLKLALTALAAAVSVPALSASPAAASTPLHPADATATTITSPGPSTTSASPSLSPTGRPCVTSDPSGACGPYNTGSTNSNGYNTYVANNCWADPSCAQTLRATSFSYWRVTANEPAGNGSVKTAPGAQQLFSNWCGTTWENLIPGGCGGSLSDTPISGLSQLTSTYTESTPHNSRTIAQFAWDNWLTGDSGYPNEVMVWVDNNNRCNDGSLGSQVAGPVIIGGQEWTPYQYGSGEFIWSLGAPGACAQQASGTVDLLALLKWMQANGFAASSAAIGEIDGIWEICSTGGVPETFRVSSYSITAAPV